MKIINKILALFCSFVFAFFAFVGCGGRVNLKKVSKKLTTYSIDAELFDAEKKICGSENVDYINNTGEELNSICFNLYGKAFSDGAKIKPYSMAKIEECFPNGINYGDMCVFNVCVNEKPVEINIVGEDNNAIEVPLLEPLRDGERVKISLEYELYLANCTHRLGYNNGKINLGNWYPIVAVYENGGFDLSPYYSNGDPFYSDCANYNVTMVYDSKYNLSSSGEIHEESIVDGKKRSKYSALAVRDFAMVLLSDFEIKTTEVDKIQISVISKSGDEDIDLYLETARRSIDLFGQIFGSYPYKTLNVVFTDFFQGGMEYPNLVYISTTVTELAEIKKVIIHEIAHQWWYGVVGNNEISCAWFDEGLAEYSTLLYYEHYTDEGVDTTKLVKDTRISYDLYIDVIKTLNIDIHYSMTLPLCDYFSEYEYVYMIYVKGLLFFDELRSLLGDELFIKCLQGIYKEYSFKNINKEKFIEKVETISGMELSEFVEGWLSGNVDISQN